MVVLPIATPVTKPDASIVAAEVFEEDQVPPPVELLNCNVWPTATDEPPEIAATTGNAFTVPLAATFFVVAPVDVTAMFPEGDPDADEVNLTYIVVLATELLEGARETVLP